MANPVRVPASRSLAYEARWPEKLWGAVVAVAGSSGLRVPPNETTPSKINHARTARDRSGDQECAQTDPRGRW
jgi:hypothetical protein